MLSQTTSSVIAWRRPSPADPQITMLGLLGAVNGLHVVVIGPGGLAAMLTLYRLGVASVTTICHRLRYA